MATDATSCCYGPNLPLDAQVWTFPPMSSAAIVPRGLIEQCLAAAGTAPNGANLQPWRFVAIADPAEAERQRGQV